MLGTVADLRALLFCCIAIVACCLLSHLGTGLPVFEVQDLLTEEDRQRHANIHEYSPFSVYRNEVEIC